ncbi:hypothetical protein [Fulvivirga lutea]|uniref:Uncharacterized protein n=1 Tax=Fulvivirga lutea TaxID=2810512 RepID=A0A974WEW9_9BACT|nr:hypothetical protein [Fulvivirga lutea]QSE96394.1 hypothetical protein JR347_12330 [Fulvivirga lutea]
MSFLAIVACNNDENIPLATGDQFVPWEVGLFHEYEIGELRYTNDILVLDTTFYLREEVVESLINAQDSVYVIYQYTRANLADDWSYFDTWQARINNQQLIVTEGNTPFVKLTFPIFAGKIWDGNSQNQLEEDNYQLDSLYFPYTINDQQFESTITVVQNDNEDFIVQQDRRFEVYALNVGLIYSEELLYSYCTDDNCLGQQQIENGTFRTQSIIDYGKD